MDGYKFVESSSSYEKDDLRELHKAFPIKSKEDIQLFETLLENQQYYEKLVFSYINVKTN